MTIFLHGVEENGSLSEKPFPPARHNMVIGVSNGFAFGLRNNSVCLVKENQHDEGYDNAFCVDYESENDARNALSCMIAQLESKKEFIRFPTAKDLQEWEAHKE